MVLIKNNKGFTLVEILVALVIDFIVLAGIYAAFYSQQKSHVKEQQVVDAQQNVRGSAAFMTREIRLAGMDRKAASVAGILVAGSSSVFAKDLTPAEGLRRLRTACGRPSGSARC